MTTVERRTRTGHVKRRRRRRWRRRCASASRRGALRRRQPRPLRHRRLQLPPGADRRRHPARRRGRGRDGRRSAAHSARRCSPRGGGTSLAGQCCNVAVVLDLSKYLNRVARDRPGPQSWRACSRASCSTTCATPAERASPHLRPRPRHPQPLHARRHARQQLLRRPLGHGRQDRATTSRSWRSSPTTACACASAHQRGRAGARSSPRAAGAARSTPALQAICATATPTSIRAALPEDSAPRLRLQPRPAAARKRLPRRPRARRHRRHLRHHAGGDAAPGPQPAGARRCWCWAIPTSTAPATTCMEILAHQPIGAGRLRRASGRRHAQQGHGSGATSRCCPTGGGWLLVEFGGETQDEGDGPGAQR